MTRYEPSPRRLVETDEQLASALRAALDSGTASDEVRAWDALERRLQCHRRPRRTVWWVAVATAAAVGGGLWLQLPERNPPAPAPAIAAETLTPAAPVPLRAGDSRLPDGSMARLDAGSVATVTVASARETRVYLQQGSVDIDAIRQRPEQRFVVEAAGHEFRVVGTRFTVTAAASGPRLEVEEGTVEVWLEERRLASVPAGAEWPDDSEPTPTPGASASATAPGTTQDCLRMTRTGQTSEAEACLERRAGGGDLDAELALYELARLQQNVRGDSVGAISTLRRYRRRFPGGAFRSEAQLTLIELLSASGRSGEAAVEAGAALDAGVAPERSGELHLIVARHQVDRGDCAAAEPHLRAASGVSADQLAVLRSRCESRDQDGDEGGDAAPVEATPTPIGTASF